MSKSTIRNIYKIPLEVMKPGLYRKPKFDRQAYENNVKKRLPKHYKEFYKKWQYSSKAAIHYYENPAKYVLDEDGFLKKIQNVPLPLLFPEEAHQGLWGGEGIVKGYIKRPQKHHKIPTDRLQRYWMPLLYKNVFYSEILDKYIEFVVTQTVMTSVNKHCGFDYYILKEEPQNLFSRLALKVKRELLLKLARKDMYPDNPQKREAVYEKYKEFAIPEEEADWYGLSLGEAIKKQRQLEEWENRPEPHKNFYRNELIDALKNGYMSDIDANLLDNKEESKGIFGVVSDLKDSLFVKKKPGKNKK